MASQAIVGAFLETFKEFPPRQKAASFTIDQAMEKMASAAAGGKAGQECCLEEIDDLRLSRCGACHSSMAQCDASRITSLCFVVDGPS